MRTQFTTKGDEQRPQLDRRRVPVILKHPELCQCMRCQERMQDEDEDGQEIQKQLLGSSGGQLYNQMTQSFACY